MNDLLALGRAAQPDVRYPISCAGEAVDDFPLREDLQCSRQDDGRARMRVQLLLLFKDDAAHT